jgi:hypothetical protein
VDKCRLHDTAQNPPLLVLGIRNRKTIRPWANGTNRVNLLIC